MGLQKKEITEDGFEKMLAVNYLGNVYSSTLPTAVKSKYINPAYQQS